MSHKLYRKEKNCLNCGAEVNGKFCSNCGQENVERNQSFFHLANHFVSDYFHFDSKFFRSLIPLFTRPGFLTMQYWEGKRVSYIDPLRLFFFVTIIFVISTALFYKHFGSDLRGVFKSDSTLAKYDSAYLSGRKDTDKIFIQQWKDSVTVKELKRLKTGEKRRMGKLGRGMDIVFTNLKYVTFFLLPVYALIFKLLYRKKRPYYIDHLVYAMHLQTFAYIVFSITLLLPLAFDIGLSVIQRVSTFIILIYVGLSLHFLYHQSWWKTIIKSMLATFLLSFVTALAIVAIAIFDAVFIQ